MKFVLLVYQPDSFNPKALSEAEYKQVSAEYAAVSSTPNVTPGLPLGQTKDAITVRVAQGSTKATEGPYVGAAGAVGGYFIFEAGSKEEAIALAARVPAARLGGAVEIRPAEVYW
jgi:hypothetical protein